MNVLKPDYHHCIVNLANSIRNEFKLEVYHPTLEELDVFLKNEYENIVYFLFDGMGSTILNKFSKKLFLNQNRMTDITSIFPTTTPAATTSIQTGLFPCEHGFIGSDLYIKDIDKIITMYKNKIRKTGEVLEYNVLTHYMSYETIVDSINKEGKYHAVAYFPFGDDKYKDLADLKKKIITKCHAKGKKFIYAYYANPDSLLHRYGTNSKEVAGEIRKINHMIKDISKKLSNTLIIVSADHGHLNCTDYCLTDYPDINDLIIDELSVEPRFTSFKVKKDYHHKFEKLFHQYFSNDFLLLTHDEIIHSNWLGIGKMNSKIDSMIGDYMAIGITNKYFRDHNEIPTYLSVHSGLTIDEMLVPLIIINKK